ncbi:MAG: hypothetical protein ACPGRZ_17125 [Alphaproteobacteria bacterium]
MSRADVEVKLGKAESSKVTNVWKIAEYKYVRGHNKYFEKGAGPHYYQSSGNLLADILIITVGSAITAASSYRSDPVVLSTKVVYDDADRVVFVGDALPEDGELKRAVSGEPAGQFGVFSKSIGPTRWQYLCRSASSGYAQSKVAIGAIHESGYPADSLHVSLAWYRSAAESGHPNAMLYAREVELLMNAAGEKTEAGEKVPTICDPSTPPTKSLRGEPVNVAGTDCETVIEAGVRERHLLIDRVLAGDTQAYKNLGTIYDRSADALKACKPQTTTSADETYQGNEPVEAQFDEPGFEDALRIATARWYAIGQQKSADIPSWKLSDIRTKLSEEELQSAEVHAADWVKRYGGRVDGALKSN